MSVFKFSDAVRVGWKAAKRPSCSDTSCQLPAAGSSTSKHRTRQLPGTSRLLSNS